MTSPFHHAPRRSMPPQRVARIFAERQGRCGMERNDVERPWGDGCGRKFRPGDDYEIDHVLALERGGTDDDDNMQLLCSGCHTIKTKDDHAEAGHIRRGYTKHVVPKRLLNKRRW